MSSPLNIGVRRCAGFTLIEMAIVMVIIMALMGGMIATLSGQMDTRAQAQTEQTLADIREALVGFAVTQGRLPCPAAANATGVAAPDAAGACTALDGFVPGITLGLNPTDNSGYVLDGWNQRVRYAVTSASSSAFTTNITLAAPAQYLSVCNSASGITGTGASATCNTATKLTDNAVALIYSLGKNGAGTGNDEQANRNGDAAFVSHDPAATAGNEFDDQMTWLSPYTLYSRMIAAGKLP